VSTVAVLGAGSWGTTLAVHLSQTGAQVRLWGNVPQDLDALLQTRENRKFLPGIRLPDGVKVLPELEAALESADFTFYVVPSQAVREVARKVAASGHRSLPVCAAKGLELGSLKRMSEVLEDCLGEPGPVILTGPSHAEEVSRGVQTAVVAAAADEARAKAVQLLCSTPSFRVYTSADVAGCEYAAALKNVIAIAAGVCDGIGWGDNTKGALLTRGLAEISRLGVALGGRRETFFGLAGLGDLITTAISRHSRNRHVGEAIGQGRRLAEVLGEMLMVAEGVTTARAACDLGRAHDVELPITEEVCAMLFEGRSPREALQTLMTRELKSED
jgi:glycerol-3-phosphate dehydrogenase (NAD(P)+)